WDQTQAYSVPGLPGNGCRTAYRWAGRKENNGRSLTGPALLGKGPDEIPVRGAEKLHGNPGRVTDPRNGTLPGGGGHIKPSEPRHRKGFFVVRPAEFFRPVIKSGWHQSVFLGKPRPGFTAVLPGPVQTAHLLFGSCSHATRLSCTGHI